MAEAWKERTPEFNKMLALLDAATEEGGMRAPTMDDGAMYAAPDAEKVAEVLAGLSTTSQYLATEGAANRFLVDEKGDVGKAIARLEKTAGFFAERKLEELMAEGPPNAKARHLRHCYPCVCGRWV